MTTTIVIPMAGAGRRFREAGCDRPKFAVRVHGRSLLEWSLVSLTGFVRSGARLVFVARAQDNAAGAIAGACAAVGAANWAMVSIPRMTDGQATTVLAAEPALEAPEGRLLIYNVDTLVWPQALDPAAFAGDGWLPCFPGKGDAWSFARADATGRVVEVREKRRISADASIGLYGFADWATFRRAYAGTYPPGAPREAGECYVAPMYNVLLGQGGHVRMARLPAGAVVPLGTPADVAAFAARPARPPEPGAPRHEAAA